MRRSFLFLPPLVAMGCTPDYDLGKTIEKEVDGPAIEVTPSELYFGNEAAGVSTTQTFRINSVGTVPLEVNEIRLDGDTSFSLTSFAAGIAPGDSRDVVVTYTSPGDGTEVLGTAYVDSDASDVPASVALFGGVDVPDLVIDPGSHDYGYVEPGDSDTYTFTLTNEGAAALTITSIDTTESVYAPAYDSLPIELEAGESTTVDVTYSPTDGSRTEALLQVGSNDPDGVDTAELTGSGAVDQPIAVCEASPAEVEAIHGSTTWRGSSSYDPSGAAITDYEWTLVTRPSGSTASMPAGGANRSGFSPDVVGTYEAELVVTNEFGVESEPCTATLEAIPGGDLWIEMYWTRSGDDMDLHLVAPGGSLESFSTDCYYANCTGSGLDWGTRGDSSDNPVLDLDDISGVGPENINIDDPAGGTYKVYVHDYPGSVYNGRNDVTLNIYIGGVLQWTDTRDVDSEDYFEPFAEIEWPAKTVTAL